MVENFFFSFFVLMNDDERYTNPSFTSNKPTYYLLDYGDFRLKKTSFHIIYDYSVLDRQRLHLFDDTV